MGQGWQARAVSVGLPVAVIKLHRYCEVGGHSSFFSMGTLQTISLLLVKRVYCVQLCFLEPMDRPRAMAA